MITADAFAQLGRSQSLKNCTFANNLQPLSAEHLHRLADVRIGEGLQNEILKVRNHRGQNLLNDCDLMAHLKSAGIEFD